jgi:hypothetical protein
LILSLLLACTSEIAVTISRDDIQSAVDKEFPIEGGVAGLATLHLDHPAVVLPGSGRIGLDVDARATWRDLSAMPEPEAAPEVEAEATPEDQPEVNPYSEALGKTLAFITDTAKRASQAPMASGSGSGGIEGSLRYSDGSFYLDDADLTHLEIAEITPERTELIRSYAAVPLTAALDTLPVYTLNEDLKQKAARFIIKGVVADDAGLKVTLGLPE